MEQDLFRGGCVIRQCSVSTEIPLQASHVSRMSLHVHLHRGRERGRERERKGGEGEREGEGGRGRERERIEGRKEELRQRKEIEKGR